MDVPNIITASRFVLAAAGAVVLLFVPAATGYPVALAIFVAAAISDWLDGALARRLGRFSPLGAFLDPLADKVIIYLYFAYLTTVGAYPVWLLMAFLARDLMHDAYRGYAASARISMPANAFSKTKTALQMASIILALARLSGVPFSTVDSVTMPFDIAALCMILALIFGIVGAAKTLSDHKRFFLRGE